ncbi:MAG: serine O-acetyltransferase [Cyanobacteria bacterium P01_E01_bin.6]
MLSTIAEDLRIIFERDPAARNWLEVILCYPGLQALVLHRMAHVLYRIRLPLLPRLVSHLSRFFTGIEIHPGAQIGKGVCIDHGMGIVIGETAIIGDYCLIYQGVTLGGTGKETGKRHPTLGENVVVGAGAKVLGNLQIGNDVRIGAGSVVLRDVPSDCTVVGVPGRIVYRSGEKVDPLDHGLLPDSEARVIRLLVDRIESLEQQVQTLQEQAQVPTSSEEDDRVPQTVSTDMVSSTANYSTTTNHMMEPVDSIKELFAMAAGSSPKDSLTSCRIQDRVIEEFLDGSGI